MSTRGPVTVRISAPTLQTEFAVHRSTTGRQLLLLAADVLQLREHWFFGLQRVDSDGNAAWLRADERVGGRAPRGRAPLTLQLSVRFWPREAAGALGGGASWLLFRQLRAAVLDGELFCPPQTAAELAALALQATAGDFVDDRLELGQLRANRHMPRPLCAARTSVTAEWHRRVAGGHRLLRGMARLDAAKRYLRLAQTLAGFGVVFYRVRCSRLQDGGCWLWLGVTPRGVNIYEDKLTPMLCVPWRRLAAVGRRDERLTLKVSGCEAFELVTESVRLGKELHQQLMGQFLAVLTQDKAASEEDGPVGLEQDGGEAAGGSDRHPERMGGTEPWAEEGIERRKGARPQAWEAPLAAAGWLGLVQQWRQEAAENRAREHRLSMSSQTSCDWERGSCARDSTCLKLGKLFKVAPDSELMQQREVFDDFALASQ